MNNDSIFFKIVIFTLGTGTGFFAAKMLYKAYYAKIAQEEIDNVKEVFENRKKMHVVRPENTMTDEEEDNKEQDERTNRNPLTRSSLDGNPYEQAKKNYSLVKEGEVDNPDTDNVFEFDTQAFDKTLPYIVDEQSFLEEFDHHDKVSLYYYQVDDVLCHDHEEIVKNVEETIGYDALTTLDTQPTVWVRNEHIGIDYEILSINKSYAELVYGIGIEANLSPREIYERKTKMKLKRRDKDEE